MNDYARAYWNRNRQLQTVLCNGCGRPVVWGKDTEGVMQALDPNPKYPVFGHVGDELNGTPVVRRILGGMVLHQAVCPHYRRQQLKNRTPL